MNIKMKLYTKKMTYSLLATGLLAGSPVDARKNKKHKNRSTGMRILGGTLGVAGKLISPY